MGISIETKVGKKRVIVIPKKIADAVKISEGQRIRVIAMKDNIMI